MITFWKISVPFMCIWYSTLWTWTINYIDDKPKLFSSITHFTHVQLGSIQQPVVAKNESPAGLAPGQQGWQTTTKCWETSSIVVRSSHSFPSKVYCGDFDGIEASMTVVAVISIVNPDLAPWSYHKTWVWHKSPFDNLKSYNLFSALGLGQWRDMTQECARQ